MKQVKYFCDGCDKPLAEQEINVRWSATSTCNVADKNILNGPYDLCLSCTDRLERELNPKSWDRPAKPMPSPAERICR